MRISIIFPLIMFLVLKYSWKTNLIIFLPLSILGFNLKGYGDTLGYLLMFVLGALLAKNKSLIIEKYRMLKKRNRYSLFLTGLLLYSLHAPGSVNVNIYFLINLLNSIGCLILITAALSQGIFSNLLKGKLINFIGKISYSLYLLHFIVLITCIKLLHNLLPIGVILLISFIGSFLISILSYYFIEVPSIKFSKSIIHTFSKHSKKDDFQRKGTA
ncbi:acyltransferase [Bacillus mobilis]|uniref:acyltransferase family protein n=1 Tax=Bacillus mobilis TaxID=2026190 RepID=UPI002E1DBDED|nr:acyltransferase [Bacillus mobilis]